jgi:hypothetical protein
MEEHDMDFAAVFAILVGIAMVGQWLITMLKKEIPGTGAGTIVGRGRVEMGFHWAAEFLTAAALILCGSGLLQDWSFAHQGYLISMGMLIYTVINSSGYFAQKREWPMIGVFAILLILSIVSLIMVW